MSIYLLTNYYLCPSMTTALIIVFCIGYTLIAFEEKLKVSKSAVALLTGISGWMILAAYHPGAGTLEKLSHHLSEIAEILFFLLGAMTIVELIDAHDGFEVITERIKTRSKRKLLWIFCLLSFFLSAVLDNLTTTIVMLSLARRLLDDKTDRFFFAGAVIISANAGGTWTPIGDITTTMLWIGGQLSTVQTMIHLFLPSLACMIIPALLLSFYLKGETSRNSPEKPSRSASSSRNLVFWSGLLVLLFVPVFKMLTGLPPYTGMLFGLALLWIITELIHKSKNEEEKKQYSVVNALQRIDVPSVLFFLGILLAIASLATPGLLNDLATYMSQKAGGKTPVAIVTGLLSAVIDNVPLVAAAKTMYAYPMDDYFWKFIAYTAGTGGSILVIGSAAGVTAMGIEGVDFFRYLKKISLPALAGYGVGAWVYILQESIL